MSWWAFVCIFCFAWSGLNPCYTIWDITTGNLVLLLHRDRCLENETDHSQQWRVPRWALSPTSSSYALTSFQPDCQLVLCWLMECTLLWGWFQHSANQNASDWSWYRCFVISDSTPLPACKAFFEIHQQSFAPLLRFSLQARCGSHLSGFLRGLLLVTFSVAEAAWAVGSPELSVSHHIKMVLKLFEWSASGPELSVSHHVKMILKPLEWLASSPELSVSHHVKMILKPLEWSASSPELSVASH